MQLSRILAMVLAVAGAVPAASAQITLIPPFTGQVSESFETQPAMQYDPCIVGRVFQNQADLCSPMCVCSTIAPNWSGSCTVFPHGGSNLAGALAGPLEFTFDRPVTRVGGWFATEIGVPDVIVSLRGPCDVQLATLTLPLTAGCGWTWYGFQSGSTPIASLSIETATGLGSHVQIDDFEADFTPALAQPSAYCTAKVNSLGCTPAIQWQGRSSYCCTSGFTVASVQVRNNKPGLLLYGVNGAAAAPFAGGTLCVAPPVRRAIGVLSGGSAPPVNDCSGVYSIDFNAFASGALGGAPSPALLIPGTAVKAQWWGRDPGFPPPNNATLSNALAFVVGWGC